VVKMKIEKVSINYATINDLDFIINGIREINKIEKEKISDFNFLKREVSKLISKKEILCIKLDNKLIGFLEFLISRKTPYGLNYGNEDKKFCWVNNMFIQKNYRSKGYGKFLFRKLYSICKRRNIHRILLDVFEVNENAKPFYQKEGFQNKIHIMEKKLK